MNKLFIILFFMGTSIIAHAQQVSSRPVFQVDFSDPTEDKPQSKTWFMNDCWWAVLPRSSGPSLWQRTDNGIWKEHVEVNRSLQGIPGRADVWYEKNEVTAVGVATNSLTVFRLNPEGQPDKNWKSNVLATLVTPDPKEEIETATIARDAKGEWWVAADGAFSVYIWHSPNGITWSKAITLKDGIGKDDICTITALAGSLIVIWSDQVKDAVQCRVHLNGHKEDDWQAETIIESGNKTADDHLHTAVDSKGTVWLVSKNSVDSSGVPQLVLRVRSSAGGWNNFPYLPRKASLEPSRPVVIISPDSKMMIAGHTIYNKEDKFKGYIEFGRIDTSSSAILKSIKVVIAPNPALRSLVNNITVPKNSFPAKGPWLILASDKEGRVYEADLRRLF